MTVIKKEIKEINGVKYFLIGKDVDGSKVWLEEAKFSCNWYWNFGHLRTLDRKKPYSFYHIDRILTHKDFKNHFTSTVFENSDEWVFLELINTIQTMKSYAEILYNGGSNYTENPCSEIIENTQEWNRINEVVIPNLLEKVYNLLENN